MARIVCVDDFVQYAEMVALFLESRGRHHVKLEIVPFDFDEIMRFNPDVLVLSIVRKLEHVREPITDFYTQVDGAKAFRALGQHPDTAQIPLARIIHEVIALRSPVVPAGAVA